MDSIINRIKMYLIGIYDKTAMEKKNIKHNGYVKLNGSDMF